MVKSLDENGFPELLDHIGIDLWRAAHAWKQAFDAGMIDRGYAWFGQARAALIPHIGRKGIRQADLVERLGMTKQAVQQLLDELAADGIVERRPDPADRRGRIVVFAAAGKQALADANLVKRQVESDFRKRLGPERLKSLSEALKIINHGQKGPF
jgi:DNA-binding MarR family transcriptional regulator